MKHLLLTTIAAVLLVGCGPSVDIHNAAYEGNIEAVKQHLANGADVNAKDEDGWSVLDMALASKNEEIITLIKTSGGHSNADKSIFVASGIGNLEAVQQHFASGVDVNAKSEVQGWTPLFRVTSFVKIFINN